MIADNETTLTSCASPEHSSEQQLIAAACSGDRPAFDELVRRHERFLSRRMERYCDDHENAEEVTVEAFARAYEHLQQFAGRASFVTWLARIATNLCLRRHEKTIIPTVSIEEESTSGVLGETFGELTTTFAPEAGLLRCEAQQIVREAVATMSQSDREILRMRFVERLPIRVIATRLGISIPAVKSRLHRARNRLRRRLIPYFQS